MLLRPERWRMRRLRLMSCLLLGLILPMLVMRWCGLSNSSGWGVGWTRLVLRWWGRSSGRCCTPPTVMGRRRSWSAMWLV